MKSFNQFRNEYLEEAYLEEKNKPTSPEKWAAAKAQAKSKFAVYPSAYANAWAAKKYKSMGGGWKSVSEEVEQNMAEETIHVGHRNSKGDWIKTSTHSNYPDAQKAMKELEKSGKKGVQHRYDHKGNIDPGMKKLAHEEVEQIDEISKEKLYRYRDKSGMATKAPQVGVDFKATDLPPSHPQSPESVYKKKLPKRQAGIARANARLNKEEVEPIDEATPAWQRKEGKSESGGLNRKGIASYRRENPGSKLSMAVTTKPSKLKPGSKAANRRKSFCARMSGMKKRLTSAKTARDPNSRINKSLRKWNC